MYSEKIIMMMMMMYLFSSCSANHYLHHCCFGKVHFANHVMRCTDAATLWHAEMLYWHSVFHALVQMSDYDHHLLFRWYCYHWHLYCHGLYSHLKKCHLLQNCHHHYLTKAQTCVTHLLSTHP